MPKVEDSAHIRALDGLRGLAAIIVVFAHYASIPGTDFLGGKFSAADGEIGVMLFFSLSGFLMAHLYFGSSATAASVARFFQKRIARVFPLYLAIVLICFLVLSAVNVPWLYPINSLEALRDHAFFIKGEWSLWTVPVEVNFYLAFPLFWLAARRIPTVLFLTILAILAAAMFAITPPKSWPRVLYSGQYFLVGIGIAIIYDRTAVVRSRAFDAVFLMGLALCALTIPSAMSRIGVHTEVFHNVLPCVAIIVTLGGSLYSPLASHWFGGKRGAWLGAISYSVYLLHIPIQAGLYCNGAFAHWSSYEILPFYLPFLLGVATLVHFGFEAPCRRSISGLKLPTVRGHLRSGVEV